MATTIRRELEKAIVAADIEAQCLPGYSGHVFRRMIADHGPIQAAQRIMHPIPAGRLHQGLIDLFMYKRLDLTVEWIVMQHRYRAIVPFVVQREAERRIRSLGCSVVRTILPRHVIITLTYPKGPKYKVQWAKRIEALPEAID